MNINELYGLIESFFEHKVNMLYLDPEKKEVAFILYNSFLFKCDLNDRYGRFGAGLFLEQETVITEFLGERCSLDSDEKSIKESLQLIDYYCRLRLPDKFLEAYDKAYLPRWISKGKSY